MKGRFSARLMGEGEVSIAGDLTEAAKADLELVAAAASRFPKIRFNLTDLTSINSIGCKTWLDFLDSLPPSSAYAFVACPGAFVVFSRMFGDFLRRGTIESIHHRWDCLECGHMERELTAPGVVVAKPCPKCKSAEYESDIAQ